MAIFLHGSKTRKKFKSFRKIPSTEGRFDTNEDSTGGITFKISSSLEGMTASESNGSSDPVKFEEFKTQKH